MLVARADVRIKKFWTDETVSNDVERMGMEEQMWLHRGGDVGSLDFVCVIMIGAGSFISLTSLGM